MTAGAKATGLFVNRVCIPIHDYASKCQNSTLYKQNPDSDCTNGALYVLVDPR